MQRLLKGLYGLNLLGAVGYYVVCLPALLAGHPIYPGQKGLLAQVAAGVLLAFLPLIIEHGFKFRFPLVLKVIYECFILGSVLLGTGMQFYNIPYWDKFLHLFSASLLAGLGLALYSARTPVAKRAEIDPLLISGFAFCFGTTIGVFWEFYEFTFDGLLGMNMQRFLANGVPLVGRAALMDTMGDLFADVFGALVLAVWAYVMLKRDHKWLQPFTFTKLTTK